MRVIDTTGTEMIVKRKVGVSSTNSQAYRYSTDGGNTWIVDVSFRKVMAALTLLRQAGN